MNCNDCFYFHTSNQQITGVFIKLTHAKIKEEEEKFSKNKIKDRRNKIDSFNCPVQL